MPVVNYDDIIIMLFIDTMDRKLFCHKIVALDINDGFDIYMENNQNVANLFELSANYLDKAIIDKDLIWKQIETLVTTI